MMASQVAYGKWNRAYAGNSLFALLGKAEDTNPCQAKFA